MSSTELLESEPELISRQELDEENNEEVSPEEIVEQEEKPWKLVDGSEQYVISIDGKPRFYSKTPEAAKDKIWEIIKFITKVHPDWNYYTVEVSENEFQLTRQYRWFVMNYEEVYRTIRYDKIAQLEFNYTEEEDASETEKEED